MCIDAESRYCRQLINHDVYPIDDMTHVLRAKALEQCRAALARDGCAVLNGFINPAGVKRLLGEARERRPQAYFSETIKANVYFSDDDPTLPLNHPRRVFMDRTNGFITSDLFDETTASRRLYYWPALTRFIADCLGKKTLHIYADPVSNMIVNVCAPGSAFTWHFDTNEFTITILLKAASAGGHFEYLPNLRSVDDENYPGVSKALRGEHDGVVRLDLKPGDLQLFKGRFSLHQVTENTGDDDRLLLIMSFTEQPNMIGSVHRVKSLYGKVTSDHLDAEENRVRGDSLMD